MVNIEVFETKHQQGVIDVILPIQQNEFSINIDVERQPDLLDIPNFYQQGCGNFWVAVDCETVIGTVSVLDIGNRQLALRKMFVNTEYRGRTQNVAKKLLDTAIAWSIDQQCQSIYLGTTEQFKAAHRFYEKHNFLLIDESELPELFPIMSVDKRFYVRHL